MIYIFLINLMIFIIVLLLPKLEKMLNLLNKDIEKFIRENKKNKHYERSIFSEKIEDEGHSPFLEKIYFSPAQIKKMAKQAGVSMPNRVFLFFSFVSSAIVFLISIILYINNYIDYSFYIFITLMFFCMAGAAYMPHLFLISASQKRIALVDKHVASFIDLMLICLDAGLTLNQALAFVAEECKKTSPLLAYELERTNLDCALFLNTMLAFDNLQERVPSKKIAQFVAIVQQHFSEGAVIYGSLQQLSVNVYRENMSLISERAQKMPGLLSAMVVIFTLPMIFIVTFGPYIQGLSGIFK